MIKVHEAFWDSRLARSLPPKIKREAKRLMEMPSKYVNAVIKTLRTREPVKLDGLLFTTNYSRRIVRVYNDDKLVDEYNYRAVDLIETLYELAEKRPDIITISESENLEV